MRRACSTSVAVLRHLVESRQGISEEHPRRFGFLSPPERVTKFDDCILNMSCWEWAENMKHSLDTLDGEINIYFDAKQLNAVTGWWAFGACMINLQGMTRWVMYALARANSGTNWSMYVFGLALLAQGSGRGRAARRALTVCGHRR